jgi:[phosphatase 2A protein]-leucine-carboxy methyltransferase
VNAVTLRDIRKHHTDSTELERYGVPLWLSSFAMINQVIRISKIEMLDEIEELDLVLEHYAVTWGFKLPDGDGETKHWNGWGLKKRNVVVEDDDQ